MAVVFMSVHMIILIIYFLFLDPNDACDICGGARNAKIPNTIPKGFKCLICNHEFSRRERLLAHSSGHTGIKAYPCPHCHRSFVRLSRFDEHFNRFHRTEERL